MYGHCDAHFGDCDVCGDTIVDFTGDDEYPTWSCLRCGNDEADRVHFGDWDCRQKCQTEADAVLARCIGESFSVGFAAEQAGREDDAKSLVRRNRQARNLYDVETACERDQRSIAVYLGLK